MKTYVKELLKILSSNDCHNFNLIGINFVKNGVHSTNTISIAFTISKGFGKKEMGLMQFYQSSLASYQNIYPLDLNRI
jgi:hypothetical protein